MYFSIDVLYLNQKPTQELLKKKPTGIKIYKIQGVKWWKMLWRRMMWERERELPEVLIE